MEKNMENLSFSLELQIFINGDFGERGWRGSILCWGFYEIGDFLGFKNTK